MASGLEMTLIQVTFFSLRQALTLQHRLLSEVLQELFHHLEDSEEFLKENLNRATVAMSGTSNIFSSLARSWRSLEPIERTTRDKNSSS